MITQEFIDQLFTIRRQMLANSRAFLSPNLYERIVNKINREQEEFLTLLHGHERKQKLLEEYSFILDTQYFEQRFLIKKT